MHYLIITATNVLLLSADFSITVSLSLLITTAPTAVNVTLDASQYPPIIVNWAKPNDATGCAYLYDMCYLPQSSGSSCSSPDSLYTNMSSLTGLLVFADFLGYKLYDFEESYGVF